MKDTFPHDQEIAVCEKKRAYIYVVIKKMNGRLISSSSLISASGTKTPGHSLQHFKTHDHFGNLISLSGK